MLFEVTPAYDRPVRFQDTEFIRIGSYKKKLRDHPEKERALWRLFERVPFELGAARRDADGDEVLTLIDYPGYFHLMRQPLPENRAAILTRLESEKIISREGDRYHVSNVGAILFGRSLGDFERLARKRLRIIIYRNDNRVQTVKEQVREVGYAIGFEETIRYLNDLLPQNEEMGQALRKEVRRYPEIAIRELVANALIHQDFSVTGAGPTVEIFARRLEITNPGTPLIDTLRFIDEPPRSRNEILASLMRRMSICEERGSGIDKVISAVELFQLPAPEFRVSDGSTIAILPGPRSFSQMEQQERIRACYQHACLQYVSGGRMTNASLRKRLGIKDSNYPAASKIIKDTIAANLIKVFDRNGASDKKGASYVPFWT